MDEFASYEGSSEFLRWWPKALIGFALLLVAYRWNHSLQWATFLVVAALLHGRLLPWRFQVLEDGLQLQFPFGRRLFLPKGVTTIRLETVGAVAMLGSHRHLGYLLHDGVLYVPDQRNRLRRALNFYGYRVL
ncbi:MAG: hypothetical protein QOF40_1685 [Actinomycetota bacterium]|jgi:hypothetical protein|nr:hypothetical protein [Actinomycetota bacterium]